ncbi:olfactory receptor 52N5-like [Biomphalaria glabrata]|uniref:Olfactory receptor 52N5-like n=1 Tax=Biomphalaria glabrata TaxID=6526 RepID=A0A9U8EIH0_BIOGL|nr:olfactory receptor 52N5-like [Biomphalaria glabrata]
MNISRNHGSPLPAAVNSTLETRQLVNAKLSQNASLVAPNSSFCSLELDNIELPVILFVTLTINILASAVLLRMRGTCDTLDHHLVSLLNVNDLISTVIFTIMWLSGWASCNKLLKMSIFCNIFGWLGSALVVWSAGIIVIMTSCRYLSLVKPLYYRTNVTVTSVTRAVVGTFIFCLLFFIWPFTGLTEPFTLYEDNHICSTQFAPGGAGLGQRIFIGFTGVAGCLTVVHVLVCNLTIVKTLRQRNSIRSQGGSVRSDTRTNAHGKRRKFGHVTLVVSFVYALCYAPFVVRLVIDTINDVQHQDLMIHSVTLSLLFLSPLLNPIVYGVFNRQFRRTLFRFFQCPGRNQPKTPRSWEESWTNNGRAYQQRGAREGQRVKVPPDRSSASLSSMVERKCSRGSVVQVRETEVTITGYASTFEMFSFSCD